MKIKRLVTLMLVVMISSLSHSVLDSVQMLPNELMGTKGRA